MFHIGELNEKTTAELYVEQKGWESRLNGDQINVKVCPLPGCGDDRWKFYLNKNTWLYICHKCGGDGNEFKLRGLLNDRVVPAQSAGGGGSRPAAAAAPTTPDPLPSIEAAHQALLSDDEVMNYLNDERGWTIDIVKRMKLGLESKFMPDLGQQVKSILYPYIIDGNLKFVKWRSLPPAGKAFISTQGRDNPLYNQDAITPDMDECIFVEGEADTLSMLSNGIESVAGIPGAKSKKVSWDRYLYRPKKRFLLFDNDDAGQKGAYEFAIRFGIDKFLNIRLPEFEKVDGTKGKDIGEWFAAGHTIEEFEALKAMATPFDVVGVVGSEEALTQSEEDIDGRETMAPEFQFCWPRVNAKAGGYARGRLIGVVAPGKQGKTTWVDQELDYQAEQGHVCMMFCMEMSAKDLTDKQVARVAKIDMSPYPGTDPDERHAYNMAKKAEFKFGIGVTREYLRKRREKGGDKIYGEDTHITSADDVFNTMDAAIKRYGVTIFGFDNLQLLADTTKPRNVPRHEYLSQLTKRFKKFCNERKVVIFLIMQPRKLEEGSMASANDVDGSGAAEKDVDMLIVLHRAAMGTKKVEDMETLEHIDVPMAFSPKMFVKIERSRFSPGGMTYLIFEGGMSWIREPEGSEGAGTAMPVIPGSIPIGAMPTVQI